MRPTSSKTARLSSCTTVATSILTPLLPKLLLTCALKVYAQAASIYQQAALLHLRLMGITTAVLPAPAAVAALQRPALQRPAHLPLADLRPAAVLAMAAALLANATGGVLVTRSVLQLRADGAGKTTKAVSPPAHVIAKVQAVAVWFVTKLITT